MSEKNKKNQLDEELIPSENTGDDAEDILSGNDNNIDGVYPDLFMLDGLSDTASNDASELLIDEILMEFGPNNRQPKERADSLDDEVTRILKSVQSSLEHEKKLAEESESIIEDIENNANSVFQDNEQLLEREKNKPTESETDLSSEISKTDSGTKTEDRISPQKMKVITEGDSSPIFGDDFAKYFGPDAGLGAAIEIFEDEDLPEEREGKIRSLFGRKRRKKKRDKLSQTPDGEEYYINTDTIDAEASSTDNRSIVVDDLDNTGYEDGSEPEEKSGFWKKPSVIESDQSLDEEDYNQSPAEAANDLIDDMGLIRVRLFFGTIICAILVYINIAPRAGLFLPDAISYVRNPYLYLFICAALLIFIMIMCIKAVAIGIRDFLILKPNMESIVTLSCILSLVHIISIILMPQWEGYFPYCAISGTSLMFAEYFRYKSQTARVRTYKAVSAMSKPYLVSCEKNIYSGQDATVKYKVSEPRYFVSQTERRDLATKVWSYAAPLIIILAVVCAAVSTIGNDQPHRFIWALSAMMTVAAPFSLCLSFNLPFFKISKHLGMMGQAIAGWSAAEEMSSIESVIVTDKDLFPPGSIVLNGLKIYGGYPVDKVISYSASIISASAAGTTKPFLDLQHAQATTLQKVTGFQYYENGGIGGEIHGESVIAGTSAFMLRTGIRIPSDVSVKNAIYIAINHELAGVFAVNYNVNPGIKKALNTLIKNGLNPVLAIRDFNITPSMVESKFNISSDTADYPPIEDRLSLSNPDRIYTSRPLAAIGREGLVHYAESIVMARNLKRSTQICLGITIASILLGMLIMFYLLYSHSPIQASPFNLLLYMGFWLVPNLIAARWAKM